MMRSRVLRAVAVAAGMFFSGPDAAPLAGQMPDTLSTVVRRAESARWSMRAITVTHDTLRGRITGSRGDSLTIGRSAVAVESLSVLYHEKTDHTATLASAGAGAVVFGMLAYGIDPCGRSGTCGNRYVMGGLGAAFGSLIGALIGGFTSRDNVTLDLLWQR